MLSVLFHSSLANKEFSLWVWKYCSPPLAAVEAC